ncbi:MAG: CYTH domain-containing protein [Brachymonas sp.]|nr:CYTH domain-containing protein [Brachymonas sp.]
MHTEIELTLCLPANQQKAFIERVTQLFPAASAPQTQALRSIYYDTPALELARQGMGLRLRQQGDAWVQTLKLKPPKPANPNVTPDAPSAAADAAPASQGLHTRVEIEHTTATQALELHRIDHAPIRDFLSSPSIAPHLRPVFETRIQRTQWQLPCSNSLLELALDVGTIEGNGRSLPISEIEIELKHGSADALFAVSQILQQAFALSPQAQNKAERGYRLLLAEQL